MSTLSAVDRGGKRSRDGAFRTASDGRIMEREVDDVAVLLTGVAIAVATTAGLLGHLGWAVRLLGRIRDRVHPSPPETGNVSVEQLAADLHRLADHLERARHLDQPAKMERLTAAALAYDWVLLSACKTLDVPVPGPAPLDSMSRLEAEAALAAQGLDW